MTPKQETEQPMSRSIAPSDDHRSDQTHSNDITPSRAQLRFERADGSIQYGQAAAQLIEAAENLDGPEVDVCRAACLQTYLEQIAGVAL